MSIEAMKLALDALEDTHYRIIRAGLLDQYLLNRNFTVATALRERLAQPEQEPIGYLSEGGAERLFAKKQAHEQIKNFRLFAHDVPVYAHPPQRTWIGLEGAEFGWFCHTDFLNARKYTKEQRKKICNQLLSEAQSWDIGEYQLMMHDSTKLKENT